MHASQLTISGQTVRDLVDAQFPPARPAHHGGHLSRDGQRDLPDRRRTGGSDDLEWERGQAWAFQQALGLVWYYAETNPAMSRLGWRTVGRIVAAAQPA